MTGYGDILTAHTRGDAMPLTPQDVQEKQFATVRLKEGYDMQEVDDFLDEVQAELERIQRENDELRDKLTAVTRGGGVAASLEHVAPPQPSGQGPTPPPSARVPEPTLGTGPHESQPSEAAAKVLALAQKTADQLVADAKEEADRLLSDAQQRADKIDSELKAKVSKIESEARQRADAIEQETAQRRQEVFGALEAECAQLEHRRDELRDFEREYRSRLKAYLQAELRKLETGAVDESPAPLPQHEPVAALVGGGMSEAHGMGDDHGVPEAHGENGQAPNGPDPSQHDSVTSTGGSLRSVASLLDDDQP